MSFKRTITNGQIKTSDGFGTTKEVASGATVNGSTIDRVTGEHGLIASAVLDVTVSNFALTSLAVQMETADDAAFTLNSQTEELGIVTADGNTVYDVDFVRNGVKQYVRFNLIGTGGTIANISTGLCLGDFTRQNGA